MKQNKEIIKDTPFGYKNSKEFFDNIVTVKFNKLKNLTKEYNTFEIFYDFIFSAGALRDWICNEFNYSYKKKEKVFFSNKYFSALHSIYNNSKHYTLTDDNRTYDVLIDGKALFPTDENGVSIWTDDFIWDDSAIWTDKNVGDSGNFNYVCQIVERETGKSEWIYLYEICKRAYFKYKKIINMHYNSSENSNNN